MLPSSSDLKYFLEIGQAANLTRAANRLGIAQPSLTLALQRLEQSVGTKLFIRSRQGVKLTKAGERLRLSARQLLDQWGELQQQTVATMNEVQGQFALGCHASVARYSLPLFLPALLRKYPELSVSLTHDLSRTITQKVLNLELDMGIVVNPNSHADLIMKPLRQDTVTLWRSPKLVNSEILLCEPSLIQTQKLRRKLARSGFTFERVVESSSLEVIASLAECGTGQAILPSRVAYAESRQLTPATRAPHLVDQIFLIYRVENRSVRSLQALAQAIHSGFVESRR